MRCALINSKSGAIENFIMALPSDHVPDGMMLVAAPDEIGWTHYWTGSGFDLTLEAKAALEAEADRITEEAWAND
ncbi:MAG: hypothetical protein AB7Q00_14445 [Phycisphaerales bacterium]